MEDVTIGDIIICVLILIHIGNIMFFYLERGYIFWPSKRQLQDKLNPIKPPYSDDWWYLYTLSIICGACLYGIVQLFTFLTTCWSTPLSQIGG